MDHASHKPNVVAGSAAGHSPASPDVPALTRQMVRGDEDAYRNFYDAYFNRLFRYLLVVAHGDEQAARDSLQATLVRVVRHIKVFPDDDQSWRWLTVLARSAFADETRKRHRYFSFLDRFTQQARVERDRANSSLADKRLQELLERSVVSLAPDEQMLVEQKYFEHLSVRQIADEMQTTEKAVESKLSRVRRKLKETVLAQLKDERQA